MSRDILLTDIDPDPGQPRQHFDAAALQELADSMTATGQAVPITVKPAGARFVIVTGERRWRAAQMLGWSTIRADVQDIDAATAQWQTLVENIQRAGLTPIEEAHAFQKLVDAGHTQTEIGKRIGKTQSYVAQKIRLLRLPAGVQDMLDVGRASVPEMLNGGRLSEGHGRQLLRLSYPDVANDTRQQSLAAQAVANGWSVKRLALEIDYLQMTQYGYFLLPIDDRWKFADLVELEKTFAEDGATPDGPRRMTVLRRMGMILNWSEAIRDAGLPSLAQSLLETWPLSEVYLVTKRCAEWERRYSPDVALSPFLRFTVAWDAEPEAVDARLESMLHTLPTGEDFEDALQAGWVNVIKSVSTDFEAIVAAFADVSQETPAELVAA
ncbi:MAG: ParB/RepB/Spo0J family partition protein [Caldilineaceae bacterium]|nr:ParB/RepB/Spo0J family partition protein [Caldilineaceae bacterium]